MVAAIAASTHLEDGDAFGNQHVRGDGGKVVELSLLQGGGIDAIDGTLNGSDDSDLHFS